MVAALLVTENFIDEDGCVSKAAPEAMFADSWMSCEELQHVFGEFSARINDQEVIFCPESILEHMVERDEVLHIDAHPKPFIQPPSTEIKVSTIRLTQRFVEDASPDITMRVVSDLKIKALQERFGEFRASIGGVRVIFSPNTAMYALFDEDQVLCIHPKRVNTGDEPK